MSKNNNTSSGGIGFLGLLTCIFITLKLIGTIAWSWWLILAPTWIPLAIAIIVCGVLMLMM
jgi:hypothetical protein